MTNIIITPRYGARGGGAGEGGAPSAGGGGSADLSNVVKYQSEDVKPSQTIYGDIIVKGKIYSSDDIIAFSNGDEGGGTAPSIPIATYSTNGVVTIDPNTLTVDATGLLAVKGDMFNLTNYYSKLDSDGRFSALGHLHTKSQITDFAHGHVASEIPNLDWSKITTGKPDFILEGDARLTNARAAADVYAWAKAPTKPTYSASEVGLGNVNNTADSTKSVNYAASAGNADTLDGYHMANLDTRYLNNGCSGPIDNTVLDTFANRQSGVYCVNHSNYSALLLNFNQRIGSASAFQLYTSYEDSNPKFRTSIDSIRYSDWKTFITSGNIGSQSVNYASTAGNADTVDGCHLGDLDTRYVKCQNATTKPAQTIYGDIIVKGKIYSSDDIIAFSNGDEGGGTAPSIPIATYSTNGVVTIDPNTLTVDATGLLAVKGDMFNLTNYYSKLDSDGRFSALGHLHTKSQITDFAHGHVASEIPSLDWAKITTGKPDFILEGDARLTNARAAADVYAWAKAATKPTYSASEVGAMPENGAYRPSLLFNTATVDKGIYNGNWHTGNYWGIGNGPTGAQVKIGSTDINGNYVAGDLQLLLGSSNKIVATVDQIPSTLPANGGNADTVDGFHKSDFWHRDNLNRSDTDFAAKNINIIGAVKSSQRNAPHFVGNWGASGYWCLGEDSANGVDWVKLVGSDGSLFNSTPANLNITGNLKVNGDIKSKTQTLMDASGNIRWTVQVNAANNALEFVNSSGVKVAAITQGGDGHFKADVVAFSPFNY